MEGLANRVAAWMGDVGELSLDQQEVVAYSLVIIMQVGLTSLGILLVSWLFGILVFGAFTAVTAASLRLMSGGAHFSSPVRCAALSSVILPSISWAALHIPTQLSGLFGLMAFIFGALSLARYAPVDNSARPIRPERKPVFRILSFLILGTWALVFPLTSPQMILAGAAGLMWQSLSLTPAGLGMYKQVDRMFGTEIRRLF